MVVEPIIHENQPGSAPTVAAPRSVLRSVAVPSEHGGWGLTAEPVLLGCLLAPSVAGLLLGVAGLLLFLARTPLKLALMNASRRRALPRTGLARRVAAIELVVIGVLVTAAAFVSATPFWIPALLAAPLVGVQLWFDLRSRSRRLVPELAGAVGIAALAGVIVLAGGGAVALAIGAWMVLAARALSSIPFVRGQIAILRGRHPAQWPLVVWDAGAIAVAVAASVLDHALVVGSVAVLAVIALQRISALRPPGRAAVIGVRQMVMGFGVVLATWIGVGVISGR